MAEGAANINASVLTPRVSKSTPLDVPRRAMQFAIRDGCDAMLTFRICPGSSTAVIWRSNQNTMDHL